MGNALKTVLICSIIFAHAAEGAPVYAVSPWPQTATLDLASIDGNLIAHDGPVVTFRPTNGEAEYRVVLTDELGLHLELMPDSVFEPAPEGLLAINAPSNDTSQVDAPPPAHEPPPPSEPNFTTTEDAAASAKAAAASADALDTVAQGDTAQAIGSANNETGVPSVTQSVTEPVADQVVEPAVLIEGEPQTDDVLATAEPVAKPPIPADAELAEHSDGALMDLLEAHGIADANSRTHAIELLGKVRDAIVAVVAEVEAIAEDVAAEVTGGDEPAAADVVDARTPGATWDNHQQKWVPPAAA